MVKKRLQNENLIKKKDFCQQWFGAIGVSGFIKVGFVLGSSVFNLYIRLTKSPTAPSHETLPAIFPKNEKK